MIISVPGHDVIGPSMFTLGSFTAVTRSGQQAVVIVVANVATVVVDITSNQQYDAIRPRTIQCDIYFTKRDRSH